MSIVETSWLATTIVETLRRFGVPLPLGYLARMTGRQTAEIIRDLKELEQQKIIKMESQGEDCRVSLLR